MGCFFLISILLTGQKVPEEERSDLVLTQNQACGIQSRATSMDGACRSGLLGRKETTVIFLNCPPTPMTTRQKLFHMTGVFQDHSVGADRPWSEEGCLGPAHPQCPTNVKVKVVVAQPCPALCKPMDCSLPGSSVHAILQARILSRETTPKIRRHPKS